MGSRRTHLPKRKSCSLFANIPSIVVARSDHSCSLSAFWLARPRRRDEKSIKRFREAIVALGPDVDPAEAQLVSETSHFTARRLQKEWRRAPDSRSCRISSSISATRDRGYCFHWAHGIGAELRKLPLKTLVLHWAEAYPDTRLEHNVIVVTARQQPLRSGYIIDGWRASGRLLWCPVAKDEYPWKENAIETAWLQHRGPDPTLETGRACARADVRRESEPES